MEQEKKEWEAKLRQSFQHAEALMSFMQHTLESFAHRYLNDPQISVEGSVLWMEGRETNMGQALKTNHAGIKEAVKNLAKTIPREQNPAIVSRVKVEIHQLTADLGKITLTAHVNWAHPEHSWDNQAKIEKKKVLVWNDLTEFRKGFPLALEEVCDLFL
ncbi:MAG: hypothetical protein ACLGG0_08720 [Bacteriovoracia bacterium]